jgi:ABC-type nitrate/sulfonate/bicarbonate transport system substrate-binding protein
MVALWSPFGFLAEKEGWVKVSSAKDVKVLLPCLIIASEKAVKERPEVVQKWLEVYMRGVDEIKKDTNKAAQELYIFEKENGIKLSEEDAVLEVDYRPFPSIEEQKQLFAKNGKEFSEAESALLKFVDFLIDQGRLKPEDRQRLIDNKFVDDSFITKLN